jgi:hypothetical protein
MYKIVVYPCDAAETIERLKADGCFITSVSWDEMDGSIVYTYHYKKEV